MKSIEKEREPIINTLQEYFSDKPFTFVLLFGSYANGTESARSDIDIGLFFNKEIDYMELGYHSAKLSSLLDKKIDITALNDLYKKDPLIAFEILENHQCLACHNQEKYIHFKTATQLAYLDNKPIIELNRATLLKRIEQNETIGKRNYVREN
ncbi:MAG: nucleotidyltransferase domain-containing protein [Epsilonproteobacteria bacterium]|nr:nucleotidyltransferase domain-containing protein [Campylobacterota bacterium]